MFSKPIGVSSTSSRLSEVLELRRNLMEYSSSEVRHRLEKVGRAASMLHMDVLLLIYHFARFAEGDILEIGPYIGGSTVAAAFGALVAEAQLVPFGYYGWGTWVGQWRRK